MKLKMIRLTTANCSREKNRNAASAAGRKEWIHLGRTCLRRWNKKKVGKKRKAKREKKKSKEGERKRKIKKRKSL